MQRPAEGDSGSGPTEELAEAPPDHSVVFLRKSLRVFWACRPQPEVGRCCGAMRQQDPCRLEVLHYWNLLHKTLCSRVFSTGVPRTTTPLTICWEIWAAPPHHGRWVNSLWCKTALVPDHCLPAVSLIVACLHISASTSASSSNWFSDLIIKKPRGGSRGNGSLVGRVRIFLGYISFLVRDKIFGNAESFLERCRRLLLFYKKSSSGDTCFVH